jgi:hypothetical protein
MSSWYTVVQYLPDPVIDECMNVGVVVFGDGRLHTRFVHDWRRVRLFGQADVDFLKDFAASLEEAANNRMMPLPGVPGVERVTEETLRTIVGRWINGIQCTPPRASLKSTEDLLADISLRFLREPARRKREARDRRAAAAVAAHAMQRAVGERNATAVDRVVRRNYVVQGRLDEYKFDVVLANGHVYSAVHGLSFEAPDTHELAKDVEATAWAIDDLQRRDSAVKLGIVYLPPKADSKIYSRARRIFSGLDTPLLPEDSALQWARDVVAGFPALLESSASRPRQHDLLTQDRDDDEQPPRRPPALPT